jgi:hypothetical protein
MMLAIDPILIGKCDFLAREPPNSEFVGFNSAYHLLRARRGRDLVPSCLKKSNGSLTCNQKEYFGWILSSCPMHLVTVK